MISEQFKIKYNKDCVLLTPNCLGVYLHKKMNKNTSYTTPLIGSLFLDDICFLNICRKYKKYTKKIPTVSITPKDNTLWEKQQHIKKYELYKYKKRPKKNYPIINWFGTDIHMIHEIDNEIALGKFNRRLNRSINVIKNGGVIFCCWSLATFTNDHSRAKIRKIIRLFLSLNKNSNYLCLFSGPISYKPVDEYLGQYYIVDTKLNNEKFTKNNRNAYGLYNCYSININIFSEFIEKHK